MASEDISTSARFVSMDTHPANCSLVITYEVPIDADELEVGRKLPQGSKRNQIQIGIPALDKLTRDDLDRAKGAVPFDMRQLSEEIMAQYPVLSKGGDLAKILEDIQLNILYLFKRKQTQIYQPAATPKPSRPPSSTGSSRLSSARAGSARPQASSKNDPATKTSDNHPMDLYNRLLAKHLERASGRANHSDEFEQQMDTHLGKIELELKLDRTSESQLEDLESQLEDLYGDHEERQRSLASIRRFIQQSEEKLTSASSNRLLVCAMLRTLRDCDGTRDHYLSKSILFCLIKFTSTQDTNEHVASAGKTISGQSDDWPELMRVVLDLLEKQTQWLNRCEDLRQIVPHYTNALLVLLTNLTREKAGQNDLKKILITQYGNTLAEILVGTLEALAKHVARYLRAPNEHYERLVLTLRLTLGIFLRLVKFKEFVLLLRTSLARAQSLVNSTVSLLNTLQLCRPGSGALQQQHQKLLSDRAMLLDVYELELELLKLITILIYDTRLKARLMRKSLLLKCVLRNLVVFLAASRKSNSLSPFDRSPVLITPFKCLYELSCSDKIKHELFRSKIIMKCLLEYLLSAATDLTSELEASSAHVRPRAQTNLDLHEDDQVVLDPQNASHYILAFWLNLSARPIAPIYHLNEGNEELREPVCDYLQLAAGHPLAFMRLVEADRNSPTASRPTRALHLSVYVHVKLLRNLSQFLEHQSSVISDKLLKNISHSSHLLLAQIQAGRFHEFTPLAVESLAVLANLVDGQPNGDDEDDSRLYLAAILEQLFGERGLFSRGLRFESECETDDLLLVSINMLGCCARNREICTELKSIHWGILNVVNAVVELKQTDVETLIGCLFTLRQLMNHYSFLQELGQSLDRQSDTRQQAMILVDNLSLLATNPNVPVVRLANSILNMLKQFEELYSLSESITCQRRFAAYNSKWLGAIRANQDEPRDDIVDQVQSKRPDIYYQFERDEAADASGRRENDDDYNQLRTIHEIETQSGSSSRLGTSSSHGTNAYRQNPFGSATPNGGQKYENDEDDNDEVDNNIMGEEDDDGEEEETFSEPDLNVIDANSMIKHLTNRREFRTELLRR